MTQILDYTAYKSPAMQQMCKELAPFTDSAAPLLFWGETGSGMGFYARALHQASLTGKLITIPCFSLDEETVQQQFLGTNDNPGWLEDAHEGTIFLKRVSEASLAVQQTLLYVLTTQSNAGKIEFSRKGGTESMHVKVRFLYSVAMDVNVAMKDGVLRRDLVDEIRKFGKVIHVPPLRERKEDIEGLIEQLLGKLNEQHQRQVSSVDKRALKYLTAYNWPGNVRELSRVVTEIYSQNPELEREISVKYLPESIRKPEMMRREYLFQLKDQERFKGRFVSSSLRMKRDSSKFRIRTAEIVEIVRVEDTNFAPPKLKHFEIKLKDGSQLAGMIIDKTIDIETSFAPVHRLTLQDVYAVSMVS